MGAGGRLIPGGSPICRGLGVRLWGSRFAHLPFVLGSADVTSPGHIPVLPCTHGASSSKLLHLSASIFLSENGNVNTPQDFFFFFEDSEVWFFFFLSQMQI